LSSRKPWPLEEYEPLTWDADSTLGPDEQAAIEAQRRDLWTKGIRLEPVLTRMAFEFGALACMRRAAKKARLR
jgi:hypothetical protein